MDCKNKLFQSVMSAKFGILPIDYLESEQFAQYQKSYIFDNAVLYNPAIGFIIVSSEFGIETGYTKSELLTAYLEGFKLGVSEFIKLYLMPDSVVDVPQTYVENISYCFYGYNGPTLFGSANNEGWIEWTTKAPFMKFMLSQISEYGRYAGRILMALETQKRFEKDFLGILKLSL